MKIKFPTTIKGWFQLGKDIEDRQQEPGPEQPLEEKNANVMLIGQMSNSSKDKFKLAQDMHKQAEAIHEEAEHEYALLLAEIRRVAKVLTGRHSDNKRMLGYWGFDISDSTPSSADEPTEEAA